MKYDLICPIGQCCAVALYLEEFGLRKMSMPFDWMFGDELDLNAYVRIVNQRFASYMKPENLVCVGTKGEYSVYRDDGSKIVSMHDFKKDLPFDIAVPAVMEKFKRRIERMYKVVSGSKDVLFVHFARSYSPNDKQLLEALNGLREIFARPNIRLLVLVHEETPGIVESRVGDSICVVRGRFWDPAISPRYGNKPLGEAVFSRLRIRNRLANIALGKLSHLRIRLKTMFHITSDGRRQARQQLFDEMTRAGE